MMCLVAWPRGKQIDMKRKKRKKGVGTPKSAYSKRRFKCPNCGVVYGAFCVKCRAIEATNKVPLESLEESDEPGYRDPTPLEIKLRARAIFNRNMETGKHYNIDNRKGNRRSNRKKRRRLWENSVRIVHIYTMP